MGLRFENVQFSYGKTEALKAISLDAKRGEILCLLGRSGCGKSTLLNLTAGHLPMQAGAILIGEDVLASPTLNPPPESRGVGLVFQEGALFPHLTVAQNIGFGIKDKAQRAAVVARLLDQIGLSGFDNRLPHTLSGGQQQRVAVARALAPQPSVLLMDEPFASIDMSLRRDLREETRRIVKESGTATILVTHDPDEAIEIADRIAIMENGRITQVGTPKELYEKPASLFVGMMAGKGAVLSGRHESGVIKTGFADISMEQVIVDPSRPTGTPLEGTQLDILIYPFQVALHESDHGGKITDIRSTGQSQIVSVTSGGEETVLLEVEPDTNWSIGETVHFEPRSNPWLAFSRQAINPE